MSAAPDNVSVIHGEYWCWKCAGLLFWPLFNFWWPAAADSVTEIEADEIFATDAVVVDDETIGRDRQGIFRISRRVCRCSEDLELRDAGRPELNVEIADANTDDDDNNNRKNQEEASSYEERRKKIAARNLHAFWAS